MADVESAPLLSSDQDAPSSAADARKWRLTQAAFVAAALVALLNLFNGGFFATLFFEALCFYLAYLFFTRYIKNSVAGVSVSEKTLLAYVASGLVPATIIIMVATVVASIVFFVPLAGIVFSVDPAWLSAIIAAGKALYGHGDLLVDGKPLSDMQAIAKVRAHGALRWGSSHAIAHVSRAAVAGKETASAWGNLPSSGAGGRSKADFVLPAFTFQDGTKAEPLIAAMLRAVSGVPVLLILFAAIVNAFLIKALTQEYVKYRLTRSRAMRREGATLRSVTASIMAISLGFSVSTFVLLGAGENGGVIGSVFVALVFALSMAFEMATGALIGMTVFENESRPRSEKKSALLVPVMLHGINSFLPVLFLIAVLKITVPGAATVFEHGREAPINVFRLVAWIPAGVIIPVAQLAVIVIAIRMAMAHFRDATDPL